MIRYLTNSLFDFLQHNPSIAAGTCTFAVAFALVAGNAFYAQSGAHPEPLWSTRDLISTQGVSGNSGSEPIVRPVRTAVIKPKAVPVPLSRQSADQLAEERNLVARIQKGLVLTGDFNGTVDGKLGPVTRAAISDFQKRNRMTVSGEPSAELLGAIMRRTPQTEKSAAAARQDEMSRLIASNDVSKDKSGSKFDNAMVEQIQKALAQAGYGDLDVDGIYGSQTREAIARFQKQHDMEVTGMPDPAILEKLGNG